MFNKKEQSGFDVIIGEDTSFDGDINAKGNIKVDGTVSGNIETNGKVFTGEASEITGDILANGAVISGKLTGNVESIGELKITKTGLLHGNILVTSFSIENGGTFEGNCSINTDDSNKKIDDLHKNFFKTESPTSEDE